MTYFCIFCPVLTEKVPKGINLGTFGDTKSRNLHANLGRGLYSLGHISTNLHRHHRMRLCHNPIRGNYCGND